MPCRRLSVCGVSMMLQYSVCMLMHKCACVPVCVTECMNYLPVISHKKHIIQTAQDKALLNPITDYNHSPQLHGGRGRGRESCREENKSVKIEGKREERIISPHSEVRFVSPFLITHLLVCLPFFSTSFCITHS